jgi:hypothetical protein
MNNPLRRLCGAHSRRTGEPCKGLAMSNGRCRMHGGLSTGRPIISGLHTKAAKASRAKLRTLIRELNELTAEIRSGRVE